jgi:hypothetical protein
MFAAANIGRGAKPALLKAGKLPRPRKIGGKNTYWTGSQVKAVQDAIERGEFDDSLGEAA